MRSSMVPVVSRTAKSNSRSISPAMPRSVARHATNVVARETPATMNKNAVRRQPIRHSKIPNIFAMGFAMRRSRASTQHSFFELLDHRHRLGLRAVVLRKRIRRPVGREERGKYLVEPVPAGEFEHGYGQFSRLIHLFQDTEAFLDPRVVLFVGYEEEREILRERLGARDSVEAGHFVVVRLRQDVHEGGDLTGLVEFYLPVLGHRLVAVRGIDDGHASKELFSKRFSRRLEFIRA